MNPDPFQKRILWIFSPVLLIAILVMLTFRPIRNPEANDCTIFNGVLKSYTYDTKSKDVHLVLNEDAHRFYINHLEKERLAPLQLDSLLGKEVEIYGVNHWTLLNPGQKVRHVARITAKHGTKVLYSEY